MKRSSKAILLSALVFPGAGHFYLKRWVEGAVLSGAAAWALYVIVSVVLNTALDITGKIESGEVAADTAVISQLITQQLQSTEGSTNLATMVLMGCWFIGILGSYWQGREKQLSDEQL